MSSSESFKFSIFIHYVLHWYAEAWQVQVYLAGCHIILRHHPYAPNFIIEAFSLQPQLQYLPTPLPDALFSFTVVEQIVHPLPEFWEHLEAMSRATKQH
jgi:hypothetical protein